MSGVKSSRERESACGSSSASSYSSSDNSDDDNNDVDVTSYKVENTTSDDNCTVDSFRYLNYPAINVLHHKDIAFLIVVDALFLSLLGYKNDHVVKNNISPSSKFKADDVLYKHSYSPDVWLLDNIGLNQLIAATNNPKIVQFKQWIKREILKEPSTLGCERPSTLPIPKVRTTKPIDIPSQSDDRLYLIRSNNRFHLVNQVFDYTSIEMLYCWRRITPEIRARFTIVHEDAINVIYNSSGDFVKALMYVEHILYRPIEAMSATRN